MPQTEVLVLDDMPAVRMAVRLAISRLWPNFHVHEAGTLADAKILFETHPAIALVISDFDLGDGDGLEFLRWIQARRKMPFLLMSGSYRIEPREDFAFIAKPFAVEELRQRLEMLFGCGAASLADSP